MVTLIGYLRINRIRQALAVQNYLGVSRDAKLANLLVLIERANNQAP